MTPRELVLVWMDTFNRADVDAPALDFCNL